MASFAEMVNPNKRLIRSPKNPMDKSTVVSIYPKAIHELKPTIQPGVFDIPAGSVAKPSILVVGSSSWWKETDENQPLLEIPNNSVQVANSIVKDYCIGLLGCNLNDVMPGLFWVPGEFDLAGIKKDHNDLLIRAAANQKRYWEQLIKMADIMWARTGGSPLGVSDDMRLAARELNLTNKDWMKDFSAFEQVRCIACGALRNPSYPVCQTCKAVADPAKAKELNLHFAQ